MKLVEVMAQAIYEKRNGTRCEHWSRLPKSLQEPYLGHAAAALALAKIKVALIVIPLAAIAFTMAAVAFHPG